MKRRFPGAMMFAGVLLVYVLGYLAVRPQGKASAALPMGSEDVRLPPHRKARKIGNFVFAPLRWIDRGVLKEDIDFVSPGPFKFNIGKDF